MSTYLCGSLSNDEYVVELLRAAIMQGEQDARVRVQECLSDIVRGWLHSHPNIEVSCCLSNEEYYVAMAFERFWQVTIDQQIEFNTLSSGLHYLRASLNGAILDRLRASSRPKEAPLPQTGSSEEPLMEDTISSAEIWELLQSGLFNEREKRLAYLLFHCGKGPREIVRCTQEFSDIYEIYHLRHNIMEQLLCNVNDLLLQRSKEQGIAETTLPTQVGQRAGVVPADRSSQIPAPITAQPQRGISRRTFMLRLAGLTVVGAAGSSLVLLTCGLQPAAQAPPTSLPGSTTLYTYRGHSGAVYAVAWSPEGKRIASGGNDGTVQVWDAVNGGHPFIYRGHSDVVEAVAWSPDGKRIASGSRDQTVQVWDAANGDHAYTYHGHYNIVKAVVWSPDSKRIASGIIDGTVQVWDAADGGNAYTYRGHTNLVLAVAWSPEGKRIASGSLDSTVQVWDAVDGGHAFTYRGHSFGVKAVAWSSEGKRIASGSLDFTVQVWDAVDGGHAFIYHGHSNGVLAVAWSPEDKRIASGGNDNTVRVWDTTNGGHAFTYRGHADVVEAVAWSPDGKRIASGGDDNTVQVWVVG